MYFFYIYGHNSPVSRTKVKTRNGSTMSRFESKVNDKSKYRPKAVKLMDQVHEVLRYHHYGKRTEEAYSRWIRWFIKYNGTRHPKDMGKAEVEVFLCHAFAGIGRQYPHRVKANGA